jgi:HSP20 family molecular chaperone IbpA
MSTLFNEHTPFDILYRNFFKADEAFAPALNSKQPHPLDIYHDQEGLYFEIACTGLTKGDISIEVEHDVLRISYDKPTETSKDLSGYIYHGLSRKSFNLGYKIAPKFDLTKINAEMENGLLLIHLPLAKESKSKSIKIK